MGFITYLTCSGDSSIGGAGAPLSLKEKKRKEEESIPSLRLSMAPLRRREEPGEARLTVVVYGNLDLPMAAPHSPQPRLPGAPVAIVVYVAT